MEVNSEQLWSVVDEIHARNQDKDPDEVERDVAEALAEVRAARGQGEIVTPQR